MAFMDYLFGCKKGHGAGIPCGNCSIGAIKNKLIDYNNHHRSAWAKSKYETLFDGDRKTNGAKAAIAWMTQMKIGKTYPQVSQEHEHTDEKCDHQYFHKGEIVEVKRVGKWTKAVVHEVTPTPGYDLVNVKLEGKQSSTVIVDYENMEKIRRVQDQEGCASPASKEAVDLATLSLDEGGLVGGGRVRRFAITRRRLLRLVAATEAAATMPQTRGLML